LGAGIMGAGVASVFARAGFEVRLFSPRRASLERAVERIRRDAAAAGEAPDAASTCLRVTQDLAEAVRGADLVSENAPENLALKAELFREVDVLAEHHALLSTNTSSLPISALAAATRRAARVVGLHWLNPPHLLLPVEVNRGPETTEDTMDTACAWVRAVGHIPIRVEREIPGYVFSRLQTALLREAIHLVESEVASPSDIDIAVQAGLGLRWAAVGPFRVLDLISLETFARIARQLYPALSAARDVPELVLRRTAQGHLGARAGAGFYTYGPGADATLEAERNERLRALQRCATSWTDPDTIPARADVSTNEG
jgi:3-hydroxybutyryl-CoA dehydrogenase